MVASTKTNKNRKTNSPVRLNTKNNKSSQNGVNKLTKTSGNISKVKAILKKDQAHKTLPDKKPLSKISRVIHRNKKLVQSKNNTVKIIQSAKTKNKIPLPHNAVSDQNVRKINSKNLSRLKLQVDKTNSKTKNPVLVEPQKKKAGKSCSKTQTRTFKLANKAPVLKNRNTKQTNPVFLGTRADKLSSLAKNELKSQKPKSSRSNSEPRKINYSTDKTVKNSVLDKRAVKSLKSNPRSIKSPVKPKTVPKIVSGLAASKIEIPVPRQLKPISQKVKITDTPLPASVKPEIESSRVIAPEKMKKLPDRWSECGQVFFTHGQAFGISPNLRTIYIGSERDIEAFLEHGKFGNDLNRLQKDILSNIREYRNVDLNKSTDTGTIRSFNSRPIKQKIKTRK